MAGTRSSDLGPDADGIPDDRLRVRVARKTAEAQDICGVELVAPQGAALPVFTAGSHVDVHLPNGLVRPYSLCNDPVETHRYLLAVLREPASRGGSLAVHDLLCEEQTLTISRPRNHFPLVEHAGRHLLLAGGIGITPILSMAQRLAHIGADFDLHYCTRSLARTAFAKRIAASSFAGRARLYHDDGPTSRRVDLPGLLAPLRDDTHLYVCGPAGFMEAVLGAARAAGWPDDRMHREYFVSQQAGDRSGDSEFTVRIASSGLTIPVPVGVTVVQAVAAAGVCIPTSCEQGICGTCLTGLLDGEADHRDQYLTPEEQSAHAQFTPCCSRSRSAMLVLDL